MAFSRMQWRVLLGAMLAYTLAYMGRLNLSAALPSISSHLHLTSAQAGLIPTVFAVVYAVGQFVNGMIADFVSPRRYMALGLLGTAICNLLVYLAPSYGWVLVIWALNGAAQSMLWTPIMRLIAGWFSGKALRRASMLMALAPIAGNVSAWMLAGWASGALGWRMAFLIPGLVNLGAVVCALGLIRDGARVARRGEAGSRRALPMRPLLITSGFWGVLVCCVAEGYVRDGVMVWTPTILSEFVQRGLTASPVALSLIIPAFNLMGVLLGNSAARRFEGRPRVAITAMMLAALAVSGALSALAGAGAHVVAVMMGLCCALVYGVNPVLVSLVPMEYEGAGRVAMTAGMIDSLIYLGAALAGLVGGVVRQEMGEAAMFLSWAIAIALGAAGMALSARAFRRWKEKSAEDAGSSVHA